MLVACDRNSIKPINLSREDAISLIGIKEQNNVSINTSDYGNHNLTEVDYLECQYIIVDVKNIVKGITVDVSDQSNELNSKKICREKAKKIIKEIFKDDYKKIEKKFKENDKDIEFTVGDYKFKDNTLGMSFQFMK